MDKRSPRDVTLHIKEEELEEKVMKLEEELHSPLPCKEEEEPRALMEEVVQEVRKEEAEQCPGEVQHEVGASLKPPPIRKENCSEEERLHKTAKKERARWEKEERSREEKERSREEKERSREEERNKEEKERSKEKERTKDERERSKEERSKEEKERTKEDKDRSKEERKDKSKDRDRKHKVKDKEREKVKTEIMPTARKKDKEPGGGGGGVSVLSLNSRPEEARDGCKHKSSQGKKEKSGHRSDVLTPKSDASAPKSDPKASPIKPAPLRRDGKKEEPKKPPRTLITFDLFKPMEAHQTVALSFKTHHHQHGSAKPTDNRTLVPFKGTKVKSGPPLADPQMQQQHSALKQTLKTHKDFLI